MNKDVTEINTKRRTDHLTRFSPKGDKAMSRKSIGVLLPLEMDEYVRSLPNRSDWLRQAIAAQIERDQQSQNAG